MNNFKCGDKIVCVDAAEFLYLTKGKIYEVTNGSTKGQVLIYNDNDEECLYHPDRFKLVGSNLTGEWVEVTGDGYDAASALGHDRRISYRGKWPNVSTTFEVWQEELPLPDKPGIRFWAKVEGHSPCWWFSFKCGYSKNIYYYSENGLTYNNEGRTAKRGQLTRLPDPRD